MINAPFQIQILPSIFFFLAWPFIKRAMAPLCSVVDPLKDFRRRYRRRESESRIEFHPDKERAFGGGNPVFQLPLTLITAAPLTASCFNALSAAFASTRSKICVRVLI